ncbi:hypothetical protein HOY34_17165 [Xinfangfangia sp. D13-10-4-6]|uniref:hypothetical protein n=1 Tax=Pseudogemmobacter hezensis TaxID=2737662 RepID=UPI00155496D2|nr:hypothetical protein [Pseudogemmobacter hezensis]NPD16926.1 hypothetical protein [Pseudogemmobacter hezensis]
MAETALQRPELTLPPEAAAVWADACADAQVVLEYGSGGSTLVAAEAGCQVWSVESDRNWAQMMLDWFEAHPADVHIHQAWIGDTKAWGYPKDESAFIRWPEYALKVWDLPRFSHPDVVLIDGRFRLGCFMTVAYRITRPVTVFFDDYRRREAYHKAEEIARPTEMIGRMARFDLEPVQLTPDRLRAYTRALLQPV